MNTARDLRAPDISKNEDRCLRCKKSLSEVKPVKNRRSPEIAHKKSDSSSNAASPNRDSLSSYLLELPRYEVLSKEEQTELAIRAKEHNDHEASNRLVESNLRLVVKIAMEFRDWATNVSDLIQEGNMGLIHAIRKYDPYRGIKFSYYASFWIRAYILKYMVDNRKLVKIGTTQVQRKLFFRLSREREKLLAQGFEANAGLLAERLDVEEQDVLEMSQRLGSREISIDSPVREYSRETYGSFLPDMTCGAEEAYSDAERRKLLLDKVKEFRETLSGKEADIFDKRIMAEKAETLQTLADRYQLSRERIRQIQEALMLRIKHWLKTRIHKFEEVYGDTLAP